MNILGIIPARMGSSRFPGKPMANILGKPMIGHVYNNLTTCRYLSHIAVATCDRVIVDYIESINGLAIMTSDKHERASDRCAEAVDILEKDLNIKFDIIVMVQGDEPLINNIMLNQAIIPIIENSNINIINLIGKIDNELEFKDQNCIKVLKNINNEALYFSRQPIPNTGFKHSYAFKQICVIPFRRIFLKLYTELQPTPIEIIESIDMLRILENGMKVHLVETSEISQSVDVIEDIIKVENFLNLK
jgi:3-deoxy-manno-octulosonate cytidylyltransferase (CMP-KDO synthetase)